MVVAPTTPAQKKVTTPTVATTPSVKSEKILTTTATSLGQQLTEQVKKSTGTTNPKSASNSCKIMVINIHFIICSIQYLPPSLPSLA